MNWLSREAGQQRRQQLNNALAQAAQYYLGPTGIPQRLNALGILNPVNDMEQASQNALAMTAPGATGQERFNAGVGMLTDIATVVAPAYAASRVGNEGAAALVDSLTGIGAMQRQGMQDAGQRFVTDESGAIRAFHGSPRNFDRPEIGRPTSSGVESPAVWFSDSENVARGYGPNMTEAKIDIEDGLEFDFQGRSTVFFDGKHRSPSDLAKRIAEINEDMRAGYGLPEGNESDLIYDMMDAGWPEVGGPDAISGLTLRNVDDSMTMFGGETSTNYAVFDPTLIQVVKKYGVAGAAAMLGMSVADVQAATGQQQ